FNRRPLRDDQLAHPLVVRPVADKRAVKEPFEGVFRRAENAAALTEHVAPEDGPVIGVLLLLEQQVHPPGPSLLRLPAEIGIEVVQCRNDTDQVDARPPREIPVVAYFLRTNLFILKSLENEMVNRIERSENAESNLRHRRPFLRQGS